MSFVYSMITLILYVLKNDKKNIFLKTQYSGYSYVLRVYILQSFPSKFACVIMWVYLPICYLPSNFASVSKRNIKLHKINIKITSNRIICVRHFYVIQSTPSFCGISHMDKRCYFIFMMRFNVLEKWVATRCMNKSYVWIMS